MVGVPSKLAKILCYATETLICDFKNLTKEWGPPLNVAQGLLLQHIPPSIRV